jgi:hypothetical protein
MVRMAKMLQSGGDMGKRVTDNDAFASGIAAYAMMQSLLLQLEHAGASQSVVQNIIEDAARSIEVAAQQMRPKHPAIARAVLLLRGSAARWRGIADARLPIGAASDAVGNGEVPGLKVALSTLTNGPT